MKFPPPEVISFWFIPSASMTQISGEPVRVDINASLCPSGDHTGKKFPPVLKVSCFLLLPSSSTLNICALPGSGLAWSAKVSANAMRCLSLTEDWLAPTFLLCVWHTARNDTAINRTASKSVLIISLNPSCKVKVYDKPLIAFADNLADQASPDPGRAQIFSVELDG